MDFAFEINNVNLFEKDIIFILSNFWFKNGTI
jgi:hypothetical protein